MKGWINLRQSSTRSTIKGPTRHARESDTLPKSTDFGLRMARALPDDHSGDRATTPDPRSPDCETSGA